MRKKRTGRKLIWCLAVLMLLAGKAESAGTGAAAETELSLEEPEGHVGQALAAGEDSGAEAETEEGKPESQPRESELPRQEPAVGEEPESSSQEAETLMREPESSSQEAETLMREPETAEGTEALPQDSEADAGTEETIPPSEGEPPAEEESMSGTEESESSLDAVHGPETLPDTEMLTEELAEEAATEQLTESRETESGERAGNATEAWVLTEEEESLQSEEESLLAEEGQSVEAIRRDYSALKKLLESWWDSMQLAVITKVLQLILAFVLFIFGRRIINSLIRLMDRMAERKGWDPTVCSFARSAARAVLYLALLMVILTCVGVQVASLAAIISSIGVALGLALQGSLSNLAGGILISAMKPIHLGDFISAAGYSGTVRDIGLVYTTLVGADDRTVVIPNSTLMGSVIENYSGQTTRRVEVQCPIAYDADLKRAMEIFRGVLDSIPERLPDKPVNVFVASLGDSGVVLEGQIYVQWTQYLSALWAVREKVKLSFDEAGIEIPLPKLDVNMKNAGNGRP